MLLKVRLPIESSRSTRSLNDRGQYKANEWRNLAFYLFIPILKNFLPHKYFKNLAMYLVYLRILCQEQISLQDLDDAKEIFSSFIVDFERMYGKDRMKFNLHSHFHLVEQVRRYGPLTKYAVFAFENMFLITREMFHGTRNYEG